MLSTETLIHALSCVDQHPANSLKAVRLKSRTLVALASAIEERTEAQASPVSQPTETPEGSNERAEPTEY